MVAAPAAAVVRRWLTLRFARVKQEQVLRSAHAASGIQAVESPLHAPTHEWGQAFASFRGSCAGSATAACLGELGMHRKIPGIYFDEACFNGADARFQVIIKHLNS